ncbi:hypothetical protein BF93_08720, partial [Brachybacterium phenoliresistens]
AAGAAALAAFDHDLDDPDRADRERADQDRAGSPAPGEGRPEGHGRRAAEASDDVEILRPGPEDAVTFRAPTSPGGEPVPDRESDRAGQHAASGASQQAPDPADPRVAPDPTAPPADAAVPDGAAPEGASHPEHPASPYADGQIGAEVDYEEYYERHREDADPREGTTGDGSGRDR